MTEIGDEGLMMAAYLFDLLYQLRDKGARHNHIFVELERAVLLHRRRKRAAHVPQSIFIFARRGAKDFEPSALAQNIFDRDRRALDLFFRTVNRYQKKRV